MWTIKPQTIYVLAGRMKVEFRARHAGVNGNGHYVMDVTEGDLTCRVRFSAGGEVLRIDKLTPSAGGPSKAR